MKLWFKTLLAAAIGGSLQAVMSADPSNVKEIGKIALSGAILGIAYRLKPEQSTTHTTVVGAETQVKTITEREGTK